MLCIEVFMRKQKNNTRYDFPDTNVIRTEIRREKYKKKFASILLSTVYALIVVAAIAVLIATLILPVVQIAGTSMEPTLNSGDIVVLIKTQTPQRGELCAFAYSNKILIKRVIGIPGDYIDIDAEGNVYVNGEMIDEPYIINKALGQCDVEFPLQVPEKQYFMLGDQRDTSVDSRNTVIGCVTDSQLVGKIVFRVWPLSDIDIIE